MNKFIQFLFLFLFYFGCTNEPHKQFDNETAFRHIKEEIASNPGDPIVKAHLISQINLILNKDTSYYEESHLRDSLRKKYIYKESIKRLTNQLSLRSLNEFIIEDEIEVYKFRCSRAFSEEIIEITIADQDSFFSIKTQVYKSNDKCDHLTGLWKSFSVCYTVLMNEQRIISQNEWNVFKEFIDETNFWKMEMDDGRSGLDGSIWVIEASRKSGNRSKNEYQEYKLVHRWSPKENDNFRKIGLFLLKLSNKDFGEIY